MFCDIFHRPGDVVVTHFFENMCPCIIPKHWPRKSMGVTFALKLEGATTSDLFAGPRKWFAVVFNTFCCVEHQSTTQISLFWHSGSSHPCSE